MSVFVKRTWFAQLEESTQKEVLLINDAKKRARCAGYAAWFYLTLGRGGDTAVFEVHVDILKYP